MVRFGKGNAMEKKIFIGAAWPYANNSLHLGHVAGLIGADIIARYERLAGSDVLYVSGSDCHGTPIVISAEQQGVEPGVIAKKYHEEFKKSLVDGLHFSYDLYTTTLTKNHEKVVQSLFLDLYQKGLIYKKVQKLPFCKDCQRFLPDRYIEGTCPVCGFLNARGDQCDECGSILEPEQLIDPKCKTCGAKPDWRESEHFFLKLSHFTKELTDFVEKSSTWRINAKNLTLSMLNQGVHDRAITRDTDWGIPIPVSGYENKRIYVWFEAVSGYLSASIEWAEKNNADWKTFWQNDQAKHYYVHGKDNIPFHSIIWPAILMGKEGLHLPDTIISSEYLTLEKKQFSKSRNHAVWLPDFLKEFDSETLRYYLISNGPETSDADFSWKDFQIKINKELIGNFGNFIHRTLSLIKTNFPEGVNLPETLTNEQQKFYQLIKGKFTKVGKLIEDGQFKHAIKSVFEIVEFGNKFLIEEKPWNTIKTDSKKAEADLAICTLAVCSLSILINPFLPTVTNRIKKNINCGDQTKWRLPSQKLFKANSDIAPIFARVEDEQVAKQLQKLSSKNPI
jgi:methionyl-tRNA synthetase